MDKWNNIAGQGTLMNTTTTIDHGTDGTQVMYADDLHREIKVIMIKAPNTGSTLRHSFDVDH